MEILFQPHKLLHIIFPVIIILLLQKKFGLMRICFFLLFFGFIKEAYDTIVQIDPLWVSFLDTAANLMGIAIGIIIVKINTLL